MDNSRLFVYPSELKEYTCDPSDGYSSSMCCYISAAAGVAPSSVIAQQEEEDTSLGEDLAGSIVSNILDGDSGGDDEDDTEIVDQDAAETATANPSQEEDQTVTQDDTVIFRHNTADLDDANVAAPLAIRIDVEEEEEDEEEPSTPLPPADDGLPPEDDGVFCFESDLFSGILCFDTLEDCEPA